MKLTPWMLTVAAFGIIALLAVGFLFKKLWAVEVVEAPAPENRVLPMAITELEPGTVITRAHVGNGPWSRTAELAPDTMTTVDGVLGRITRERVSAAQPLRGSMFYAPGDLPDQKVAADKRAVAIQVSSTTAALLQKLKPEQYVDVQLTIDGIGAGGGRDRLQSTGGSGQSASGYGNAMTVTLFKGVKIVSLNRGYSPTAIQGGESQNVTLELDEHQARIALLAQQKGEIDLIYNPGGPGTGGIEIQSEKDRVTLHELLGLKTIDDEKPFRSEHYRGSGNSSSYFRDGERVGGFGGSDAGLNGDRLQSNGNSDNWSTDTSLPDKNKNVAQKQVKPALSNL